MQLKKYKKGRVWQSLGLFTANLFMATHGMAESGTVTEAGRNYINDVTSELGTSTMDSSVLFYKEAGGRVQAIEPTVGFRLNRENGDVFSGRFIYDTLTGATPNGAVPWSGTQVFTTPAPPPNEDVAVTSASGNTKIVTIPGTGTRVAQYTIDPHQLPVDKGFQDQRYALNMGYSSMWHSNTITRFGFNGSQEKDYSSYSANAAVSQAFNNQNTTLSLGVNYEYDKSDPLFGIPTPLTEMNGLVKGSGDTKTVTSLKAGLTQVLNRHWLLQLNYDIGWSSGYQTDPYKILSVVNPTTGAPLKYVYESRPDSRTRQSIYLANKIAVGGTTTDLSFRYYHDSWGVKSITAKVSEIIPISSRFYLEPEYRYYRQTAADFFHYYLLDSALPDYASADYRLAKFNAQTIGLKAGCQLSRRSEVYLMGEYYHQAGDSHIKSAPGELASEKLFSGVDSANIMLGFSYRFDVSDF